jgi:hypothetical protein
MKSRYDAHWQDLPQCSVHLPEILQALVKFTAQSCDIYTDAPNSSLGSQGMSEQLSTMLYAPLPAAAVARRIRNGTTNLRFFQKMQKMLKDSLPGQQ